MTENFANSGDEWAEETQNEPPAWVTTDYVEPGTASERTFSRRRSMECSSIELEIVETEVNQDHTVYVIKVNCGMRSWLVKRRYKDFDYLDRKLRKFLPAVTMPSLPPKSYWRSSNNPSIVEQRKQQLQDYLRSLLGMNQIWARNDLVLFLNDDSNIMTFIWSVERMRRLKEMLRLTKVEDSDAAEKLSSDLEEAKRQVEQLQTKLSQMEMIFLQQATGVASQQLSSTVLRSLSRADGNPLSLSLAMELTQEHAALYQDDDVDGNLNNGDDLQVDIAGPDATGASGEDSEDEADHENKKTSPQVTRMDREALMKALTLAQGSESVADYVKKKTAANNRPMSVDEARTLTVSYEIQEALRISEELLSSHSVADVAAAVASAGGATDPSDSIGKQILTGAASSVDAVMKGLLHQEATATISALLDYQHTKKVAGESDAKEDVVAGHGPVVQWISDIFDVTDHLLKDLAPSTLTLDTRLRIFKYVRDLIARTVGCQAFPYGSFVSHTFLPDGDLDVTAFVPKLVDDAWYVKINEALCFSAVSQQQQQPTDGQGTTQSTDQDDGIVVRNVSFVNAGEVKEIRSVINGIRVDIATNQLPSILVETLIERVDDFVGQEHLFKRSLLLVKAWLSYQAVAPASSGEASFADKLSTSAIVVILVYVFQHEGAFISSPFQTLVHFLLTMLNFDWAKYAMTMQGMVKLSDLDAQGYGTAVTGHHHHHRHHHHQQNIATTATPTAYFPESLFDFAIGDEIRSERALQAQALSRGNSNTANTVTPLPADGATSESATPADATTPVAPAPSTENKAKDDAPAAAATATESSVAAAPVGGENKAAEATTEGLSTSPATTAAAGATAGTAGTTGRPRNHHHNHHKQYHAGIFNVLDPFQTQHNLLGCLDVHDIELLVSAVVRGYKQIQALLDTAARSADGVAKTLTRDFWSSSYDVILQCAQEVTKTTSVETTSSATPSSDDAHHVADVFEITKPDLHFSRFYGSIALGGKIELATLTQMILIILDKRGPMPVGEIGKNLQAILGCENLSRRLKEQFTGLKRAIENANTPRLRVGNEHQFNPVVALVGEGSVLPQFAPCEQRWALHHAAYMFTPYQIHLAMQAQLAREVQLQQQQQALAQQQAQRNSSGNNSQRNSFNNASGLNPNNSSGNNRKYSPVNQLGGRPSGSNPHVHDGSNSSSSAASSSASPSMMMDASYYYAHSPVSMSPMSSSASSTSYMMRMHGNNGGNASSNNNANGNNNRKNNNNNNNANSNNNVPSSNSSLSGASGNANATGASYSPNARSGNLAYHMRSPTRRNNNNNNNNNNNHYNNGNNHANNGYNNGMDVNGNMMMMPGYGLPLPPHMMAPHGMVPPPHMLPPMPMPMSIDPVTGTPVVMPPSFIPPPSSPHHYYAANASSAPAGANPSPAGGNGSGTNAPTSGNNNNSNQISGSSGSNNNAVANGSVPIPVPPPHMSHPAMNIMPHNLPITHPHHPQHHVPLHHPGYHPGFNPAAGMNHPHMVPPPHMMGMSPHNMHMYPPHMAGMMPPPTMYMPMAMSPHSNAGYMNANVPYNVNTGAPPQPAAGGYPAGSESGSQSPIPLSAQSQSPPPN